MRIKSRRYWSTKRRSQESEQRAARAIGGRTQPGSGAVPRFDLKADVKSAHFLLEDKCTAAQSYRVTVDVWNKINRAAFLNKRMPLLRVEFEDGPTLYVLSELDFLKLAKDFL